MGMNVIVCAPVKYNSITLSRKVKERDRNAKVNLSIVGLAVTLYPLYELNPMRRLNNNPIEYNVISNIFGFIQYLGY